MSSSSLSHYQLGKKHWMSYLWENKVVYFLGVLFVLCTAMFQVLVTRTMGWILDFFTKEELPKLLMGNSQKETFYRLFFLLVGARVSLFFFRVGWRLTMARQTHMASAHLKENVWDNVRFFRQGDLIRRFTKGVLMNANTSDVNRGRFIYGFTLVAMFDVAFLGFFTLFAMLTINVPLSLMSLGIMLVLPYFVKKLSQLEMNRYRSAQEFLGTFNDLTTQVVSTIRLQRVTQSGGFWFDRMMDSAENYRKKRLTAVFTSLRYIPVMGSGSILSYVILFFVGIPFVVEGKISIGDFVAMQGLIFLLQDPLAELGFIISEWKKSFTSLERLSEIFHHEKDPHLKDKESVDPKGLRVLKVSDLNFIYDDGEESVINGFSLVVNQGQRVGITGPIGSGKSTLIKILSGIERHHEGEVLFMGEPFRHYSHNFLRGLVGYVPQKAFLFADTIRENVRLDRDLSDEEVWHYLDLACLDEDVRNFPDQLDTPLGEWGINLSGGQKQRLTLARALARQCQVYFFDDCLSAVDTVTEEKILSNLDRVLKEETLIWVAHRSSTLKYCDHVVELGNE